MKFNEATIGIPVTDLARATAWYQNAFDLGAPDQEPLPGLAEWNLGPVWLQLAELPDTADVEGISLNISVDDATATQLLFADKGLTVSDVQRFEGAVEYFELTDPDGNAIGFVTELG
ncbi:VOC family protein [Glaciihabitans sp. dw_435]|uniref:VOC family protein n=1 Tax=Glaciihabitans sp. dw_435 TaxID=2720081 RepID=UPI001BD597AE|nr:VOC family protein [Glaciihabitans sp. dw_435]